MTRAFTCATFVFFMATLTSASAFSQSVPDANVTEAPSITIIVKNGKANFSSLDKGKVDVLCRVGLEAQNPSASHSGGTFDPNRSKATRTKTTGTPKKPTRAPARRSNVR